MARRRKRGQKKNTVPFGRLDGVLGQFEDADTSNLVGNREEIEVKNNATNEIDDDEPPLHCLDKESMPVKLRKYWDKRYSLFSKYDDGILMDRGNILRYSRKRFIFE